jgi:ABC-type glycerol-3-phosphate transport system substrate-binding protein
MTPKKQKALVALLTQPTKEKAAAAAGITSKTLRGYLDDPEFQAEYRKAFAELVEDATRKVQQTLDPAVAVLREIMEDRDENGQVRVSAARSVLEYGLKMTEQTDIITRLQELEAEIGGEHGQ